MLKLAFDEGLVGRYYGERATFSSISKDLNFVGSSFPRDQGLSGRLLLIASCVGFDWGALITEAIIWLLAFGGRNYSGHLAENNASFEFGIGLGTMAARTCSSLVRMMRATQAHGCALVH